MQLCLSRMTCFLLFFNCLQPLSCEGHLFVNKRKENKICVIRKDDFYEDAYISEGACCYGCFAFTFIHLADYIIQNDLQMRNALYAKMISMKMLTFLKVPAAMAVLFCIYIYSFSRLYYPKRLTNEE